MTKRWKWLAFILAAVIATAVFWYYTTMPNLTY